MIKYIPFILLVFLASCSPAPAGKSKPTATQQATEFPAVMIGWPTVSAPTDTPEPTIDTGALIRRVNEAERLAQEAIAQKNAAVADKNAADATANSANVRALEMTATLGAQGIERANIAGTQQVISATIVAAQIAQNNAIATQTAVAPKNEASATAMFVASRNAATAAGFEPLRLTVGALTPIILIVVIGALVYIAMARETIAPEEFGQVDTNEAEPVQISTRAGEVFQHSVNITVDEMSILRRAAIDLNGRFSRRTLSPPEGSGEEKYFTDGRAREIIRQLQAVSPNGISYGSTNPDESTSLTDAGRKWLYLPPASPPDIKSPITQPATD